MYKLIYLLALIAVLGAQYSHPRIICRDVTGPQPRVKLCYIYPAPHRYGK